MGHPLKTARAIITSTHGEILLVQRALSESLPGLWELPGGKLNPGESGAQAVVREVREEAGLVICDPVLVTLDVEAHKGSQLHTSVFGACIAERHPPITLRPHEHSDAGWFLPSAMPAAHQLTSTAARLMEQMTMAAEAETAAA